MMILGIVGDNPLITLVPGANGYEIDPSSSFPPLIKSVNLEAGYTSIVNSRIDFVFSNASPFEGLK